MCSSPGTWTTAPQPAQRARVRQRTRGSGESASQPLARVARPPRRARRRRCCYAHTSTRAVYYSAPRLRVTGAGRSPLEAYLTPQVVPLVHQLLGALLHYRRRVQRARLVRQVRPVVRRVQVQLHVVQVLALAQVVVVGCSQEATAIAAQEALTVAALHVLGRHLPPPSHFQRLGERTKASVGERAWAGEKGKAGHTRQDAPLVRRCAPRAVQDCANATSNKACSPESAQPSQWEEAETCSQRGGWR